MSGTRYTCVFLSCLYMGMFCLCMIYKDKKISPFFLIYYNGDKYATQASTMCSSEDSRLFTICMNAYVRNKMARLRETFATTISPIQLITYVTTHVFLKIGQGTFVTNFRLIMFICMYECACAHYTNLTERTL